MSGQSDISWRAQAAQRAIAWCCSHRNRHFRARDGRFVEVWHLEDVSALMRGLELEPPKLMLRLAAARSARRYKRMKA